MIARRTPCQFALAIPLLWSMAVVVAADDAAPPPTLKDVIKGQPVLKMDADHGNPVFTLHFNGTATTRTVAVKPPVKAYNTGFGGFDVHREIRFDGSQFSEGPASIEATYRSKLDRLATPPRLRGWIVRRFAGPKR